MNRTDPVPPALVAALAALVVPGDRKSALALAGAR
jgi:hypothetical protein